MEFCNLKCKTKEFWEKNKEKIKTGVKWTVGIVVVGTTTILIIDNNKKKQIIDKMGNVIGIQNDYIAKLENAYIEKDNLIKRLESILLRLGNSEGARQMANRRWLNS